MAGKLKLHYFKGPGRAEVSRLCLTVGGIPYEDVTYDWETFSTFKDKAPFGQVPVLEFEDGKLLAQSGAGARRGCMHACRLRTSKRYCAKLSGLYPAEPLAAAHADQVSFLLMDLMELFTPTWRMPQEEKIKTRQELIAGKAREKLLQLQKTVEQANANGGYVAGDKLSFADLGVFVSLSGLTNAMMDGVPRDLLDGYPALKAFRHKVASLPAIRAYYQERSSQPMFASFMPDAEA